MKTQAKKKLKLLGIVHTMTRSGKVMTNHKIHEEIMVADKIL